MLNRRFLRVKVLQALYSFFQSGSDDLQKGEKELFTGVNKTFELYHYLLLLLTEIRFYAERLTEEGKNKLLPSKEDLEPSLRFANHPILLKLASHPSLLKYCKDNGVSWQASTEIPRRLFISMRSSETYTKYLSSASTSFEQDKAFLIDLYYEFIVDSELLENYFEEKNIYWSDDFDFCNAMVIKTLQSMTPEGGSLMKLYKNEEEDTDFLKDLFRKTIHHSAENESYISEKTKNWEVERIAMMDILLMKMAITEILHFPSVPVKVSLNEYIELSKMYSTPKSKVFINGILDKLVQDFRSKDLIKKTGRGLME
jgi:transcription antitermination protein NusB